MGAFSLPHLLILLVVVVLLFGGGGKISSIMGDLGKGIKNFRTGLSGDDKKNQDDSKDSEPKAIETRAEKTKV